MKLSTVAQLLCALFLGFHAIFAKAVSYAGASWEGRETVLNLDSATLPEGGEYNINAQYAMSEWSLVIGSNFKFWVSFSNCEVSDLDRNCVKLVSGNEINGALGLTSLIYDSNGWFVRTPVRFNKDVLWVAGLDVGEFSYGPPYSFMGVAIHEFGHVLGLCHEDSAGYVVTMNSYYSAGSYTAARLHGDDRLGVRTLYPVAGGERDLIAYMWKMTDDGGRGCSTNPAVAEPVISLPPTVSAGDSLTMEYSYENAGNLGASNFGIGFYMSTNDLIHPGDGDTLIGANSGASAPAHSHGTYSVDLTIPDNTPAGDYYLGVCVDHTGTVSEDREWNNCARAPGQITVPPPDLVINSISMDEPTIDPGFFFFLYATIHNQGGSTSTATTVRYYLSDNLIISTGDTELTTEWVSIILSGDDSWQQGFMSIDSPGSYWIGACVDPVASELNVANNCSSGIQVTVLIPELDLVVRDVAVSDSMLLTGQTFTINATVLNQGSTGSESTILRYYLSTNESISSYDTEIDTDSIPALSSGDSLAQNAVTQIDLAGDFWVGACVDEVPGESVTSNNCSSGVHVSVSEPIGVFSICSVDALNLTAADTGNANYYKSESTISAGNGFTVEAGTIVEVRAATSIAFVGDFSVELGADFSTVIDPSVVCNP